MNKLYTYQAGQTDPYINLAREELLLDVVGKGARATGMGAVAVGATDSGSTGASGVGSADTTGIGVAILYLWQNAHTVVIGRNQNALDECNVQALENSGGKLARRLSGGGAVYHDLGNLNFTFLTSPEDFDVSRQMTVLLEALASLGVAAEKSGRNDLTIDGRKFSGHAFYHRGDASYHHGTLMVDVDFDEMSRYLNVSPLKLGAKGVSSVRSRVTNLRAVSPSLTIPALKEALVTSFEQVFGGHSLALPEEVISADTLTTLTNKYASDEWRLRNVQVLEKSRSARFEWGTLRIDWSLTPDKERFEKLALYSDALEVDLFERIPQELAGVALRQEDVEGRLCCTGAPSDIAHDIATLLVCDESVADSTENSVWAQTTNCPQSI